MFFIFMEVQLQGKFPQLGVLDEVISAYEALLDILTSPSIGVMPFTLPPEIFESVPFHTASPTKWVVNL